MPKIYCCLCSRRTDTSKQRARIGTPSVWPIFQVHVETNGLDKSQFSINDYVCMKCHCTIAYYRLPDRGPNKKVKVIKPLVFETIITKDVLRRFSKSNVSTEGNEKSIASGVNVDMFGDSTEPIGTAVSEEHPSDLSFDILNLPITDVTRNYAVINTQSSASEQIGTVERSVSIDNLHNDYMFEEIVTTSELNSEASTSSEKIQMPIEVTENMENTNHTLLTQASSSLPLKGVKSSQSRCFICKSETGRKVVPWAAIQQAWFEQLCYIPKSNRVCPGHLTICNKFSDEALQIIGRLQQEITVDDMDLKLWLLGISDLPQSTLYNFEEDGIEADAYKMLVGITKENFDDLVQYLHGMRNSSTRSIRNALGMFLMVLRNNLKQEIVAFNFSTTQQVVSNTIDAVSAAVTEYFVPKYLGYYHITREEALENHSIKLTSSVLGQSESRLCLIADCTYNYIEAPSNFELQRKTFSLHKKRNLLKPLYIVLPSGYILEAAGPYFCDAKNNDAANIRHHYKHSDLLLFLEEDDFFIFDRGFRDVVSETNDNGQSVFMPCLLGGKRTHFTCEEANESRKVTMNRWVVEAVNARIKNVFPFFKHTIEGSYVPKIMRFNRIACAIVNKYFPPLFSDKDFHDVIIQESKKLSSSTNDLKEEIEQLGIQRMSTRWEKATGNSVPEFPQLSMDDLKRLTLGTYQIKIAEKYIEHHIKNDNNFRIFIHRENKGFIRAKIQSRFSRSKTHNSWIKFDGNKVGYDAIKGLYCSCKVGERSFGCCSHLTSVIRYLGYDRHQQQKQNFYCRLPWDAIDCDPWDAIDCDDGEDNVSEDEVDDLLF